MTTFFFAVLTPPARYISIQGMNTPRSNPSLRSFPFPAKVLVTSGLCLAAGILIVRQFETLRPLLTKNFLARHLILEREKVKSKARAVTLNHMMPSLAPLARSLDGSEAMTLDQYSLYAQYYAKVAEYMPDHPDAYGLLGYCYYHLGETDRSLEAFEKAAQIVPQFFWFSYDTAALYFQKGEYTKAARHLERALAARPEGMAVFLKASKLYRDIMQSAEGPLVTQEKLRDGYRRGHQMLILSFQKLDMYPQMLASSMNAVNAGVGDQDLFYYYGGQASFEMKDYSQAVALLWESIQRSPERAEAYRYLGLSLRAMGNEETAAEALQTAARLSAKGSPAPDEQTFEPRIF